MPENNLLSLIIFAPLAGAALNWFLGRRLRSELFSGLVACASVAVSTVLAFFLAFKADGALHANAPVMDQLWTWIEVGGFRADFGLAMDRLSGIYTLFITFIGLLIHVFATGYMHGDRGFYRFFAYLNLFMFSMLTLVLADNFLLMFVGWEGVGLCSYLLIGYYTDRKEAGDAAKKAFIANRVGDWGVVLGIMLVFVLTGTISFFPKPQYGIAESALQIINGMSIEPFGWKAIFAGGITSAAVLLFIGATGKSAQIPLFVWLPDAMAGPTPVSALIHAATMVTAGVYMVARCSAIYTHAPTALFIVAIIGAATAIFAATIGLAQNDIKKVLAYSTVSQLGYMFLACGVGAFVAAIFHVMTHAFFKALLFLGSGSVIHGMHHEQDMRRMGGLKKYMPITFITMMAGWLAICGIPIWAGFFSKDEILWKTWSTETFLGTRVEFLGKFLWVIGAFTAALTAVYMTRLMVMTFWGAERFREAPAGGQADEAHAHGYAEGEEPHDAHMASAGDRPHHEPGDVVTDEHGDREAHDAHAEDHHTGHHSGPHADHHVHEPHESPWTMTVPLIILAILSTVGGLVGIPYALSGGRVQNYFEHTLEPAIAHAPEPAEGAREGAGAHENSVEGPRFLSPTPQPHDGASPLSVGEGAQNEPAAERAHSSEEVNEERLFSGISILIALVGISIGWFLFWRRPLTAMPSLLENKYYVDEIYDAAIINPIKAGSREGLWKLFDVAVIDGIVNGLGRGITQIGAVVRYLQGGFVRSYAAVILLGALALIGYIVFSGIPTFFR
jgi:NADH-quinone oxidoreductase subunit L